MSLSIQNKPETKNSNRRKNKIPITVKEACIFAMLAALMFASKILMELLPNIHLIGVLTMVATVVYRKKALFPIYLYVFINGLYAGFSAWWLPYLYIWTLLWGMTMLLPKNLPRRWACIIYPIVCALHGLAYGTLYAPVQMLIMNLTPEQTLVWIAAGFPWDVLHAAGNLALGVLVYPLSELLKKLSSGKFK